jgi:hypothetical protein
MQHIVAENGDYLGSPVYRPTSAIGRRSEGANAGDIAAERERARFLSEARAVQVTSEERQVSSLARFLLTRRTCSGVIETDVSL